jgi:hypothetical protein
MHCEKCKGNIIRDSWNVERCLQCGRPAVKPVIYSTRSMDDKKGKEGVKTHDRIRSRGMIE